MWSCKPKDLPDYGPLSRDLSAEPEVYESEEPYYDDWDEREAHDEKMTQLYGGHGRPEDLEM